MSFVSFYQEPDSVSGISIYDAPPEWELTEPVQSDELVHTSLENEEGTGSWLIFNQSSGLWGTILRSGESPYNDCLPPSETFLLEAFRQGPTTEDILQELYNCTEDQFLNPFQALVGNLENNNLYRFTGSFQSNHSSLETGTCFIKDNGNPTSDSIPAPLRIQSPTGPDELKTKLQKGFEEAVVQDHLTDDGMRSPRFVTLFSRTPDTLHLESAPAVPPDSEWVSTSLRPTETG